MRSIKYAIALLAGLFAATPSYAQSTFSQPTYTGAITLPGQHTLVAFHTTVTAASGVFVMGFDAVSAPSSGSLATPPAGCFYVGPTISPSIASTLGMSNTPAPIVVQTGLVLVLSSTGCATYTPTTGYLSVTYQ